MPDCATVQALAVLMGYPETALWIQEHRREYSEGIFRGFVISK
jgi:UDP-N-acetyl-D-mannosaminuronic acid transferase (WecB/TagA/CpsF family)